MGKNDTTNNKKAQTPPEEHKPEEKQIYGEEQVPEVKRVPDEEQASKEEQKPEPDEEKKAQEKQTSEKEDEQDTLFNLTEDREVFEEEEPEKEFKQDQQKTKDNFPIVGIGASAGGLGAFEAFFSGIPANINPGVAFVLIQHLDPKHKSMLTDLISRYTNLPVYEITDNMEVKPNCVFVIPPNKDLLFQGGSLHLIEPLEPHGHRMPIDFFFRSLAEEKEDQAIGIVLSGTGSDGTLGIRSIKAEGGMIMAQNPDTSEYDSMPRSVIDTGLADYILTPKEMPAHLIAYVNQALGNIVTPTTRTEDSINRIFNKVLTKTGHDFSHYKKGTITRRIERRMAVHAIKHLDEYVNYLDQKPAEVEALYQDFLISVTSFFRNKMSFDMLSEEVIPNLFIGKSINDPIRIWVAGCSTGEEAYSIAILLQEHMEAIRRTFRIQVFATDIDARAIERARTGVYPASIAVDVSTERLERFFSVGSDGNYRIHKNIREMVIFSEHDLIKDPPFSRLDLLSCRNVLIYMDGKLQKRLIPLFYYALNSGKYLFLGSSETIDGFTNLFDTLDRKAKLYKTRQNVGADQLRSISTFIPPKLEIRDINIEPHETSIQSRPKFRELTERILLQNYAPVGVLVNEKGDILYIFGRTGMYLEPAPGEAGMNILKMAREGLYQRLSMALHIAIADKKPLYYSGVKVKTNGDFTNINLTIIPVAATPYAIEGPDLFLIVFEEHKKSEQKKIERLAPMDKKEETSESGTEVDPRILELKEQLRVKEEELKATNEELETSTEELKSANEEMQSINEELQSSNEELESSKEELQSVNEELTTVNTELQNKVTDLTQVNNDMNNLLAGTDIGTIFLDYGFRIMRFTPAITSLVNLIPTDVGRPIWDIVSNIVGYDNLIGDIKEVLDKLTTKEIEVQTRDGMWFMMRIKPYRTLDNVIKGAVITFMDITELRRARELLKESETVKLLALVVHDSNDAITLRDLEGNIMAWNPSAEKMYGWSEAEALKMNISTLVPRDLKEEELDTVKKLSRSENLEPYRTKRLHKDGRIVDVWLTASSLVDKEGNVYAIATTERMIKENGIETKYHE